MVIDLFGVEGGADKCGVNGKESFIDSYFEKLICDNNVIFNFFPEKI